MRIKRVMKSFVLFNVVLFVFVGLFLFFAFQDPSFAQPDTAAANGPAQANTWGYISAALAVGLSSLGAAIAVAAVGSSAMGAMSEKPELGGRALIFMGLAEGIAIYGLIVAIMILQKF